ncbi:MAG: hypothetical protein ACPGN3_17380 [Opitutales bacterium]
MKAVRRCFELCRRVPATDVAVTSERRDGLKTDPSSIESYCFVDWDLVGVAFFLHRNKVEIIIQLVTEPSMINVPFEGSLAAAKLGIENKRRTGRRYDLNIVRAWFVL